jgi:hypothetical protein
MVKAGKTIFVAGPADIVDEVAVFDDYNSPEVQKKLSQQRRLIEDAKGGVIHAVSADDGKRLAEFKLKSIPVWDGMIAAHGEIYLSALDGTVVCLGK